MPWSAKRSPRRPARHLPRRRGLVMQLLENRRVLADLGIGIEFLQGDGVTAIQTGAAVLRGETVLAQVQVQDQRDGGTAAGLIGLPVNIDWNSDRLTLESGGNLTQSNSPAESGNAALPPTDPLVTSSFTRVRVVGAYNETTAGEFDASNPRFDLAFVGGGAFPNLAQGQAIGATSPETFSQLQFTATANASATNPTFITVQLAGAVSFADAVALENVVAIAPTMTVDGSPSTVRAGITIVGGSISGNKFNDLNGNGARDAGEAGVAGITINLVRTDVAMVPVSLNTDVDGNYRFSDLPKGTYSLSEATPAGTEQTAPAAPYDNLQLNQANQNLTDLDFGNHTITTTVSGMKFNDINGDGVRQADENGVGGITIQLNVNNNGADVRSVITNDDGSFRFEEVPAGMHSVAEMLPLNALQTTPGGVFMIDANPPAVVDGLLFGNFTRTSLSGVTFEDTNNNNTQDAGELGIQGVTVQLDLDSDGSIDLSELTDQDGRYRFTDVGPGTHRITELVPVSFLSPSTPVDYSIPNRSGVDRDDLDFALRRQPDVDGSIQGFVYTDNDFDGNFAAEEFGLAGFSITLTSADNVITRTTTTGTDGSYVFSNLPTGDYRISETQTSGFGDASISLGKVLPSGAARGTTEGFNTFVDVQLGENETAIDYNFGEVLTAVTKRMTLASTNVRRELAVDAGLPAVAIQGTPGDDLIQVVNLGDQGFQIFVNDEPAVVVRPEQASQVTIDGGGGTDRVEYSGSDQAEQISARPFQLSVITPRQSLGVFDIDAIRVRGGGGDDTAILRDSGGADTLAARNSELLLLLAGGQSIGVLDVPHVQVISDVDAEVDTAEVAAIDFVLQLAGDWR